MRILHINCNYIGTTLHQCMIEHMDELGIQSQVYVPTYDASNSVIVPNSNVCVSECFNKWDRVWFYHKQKKIINDIENKINVKNFDVIHAYTLFTDGNCAMQLHKKYGVPYVVAIRNTDVNAFFKYMIHLRHRGIEIMKNASAIFFLSPAYRQQVFDKYVPSDERKALLAKTYIIPNGIDDFWFKNKPTVDLNSNPEKKGQKRIKLIYAGRIDANKNIETTLKAVDALNSSGYDVTLTVVGKVVDNDIFRRIIKHPNLTYIKAQPKEELIKIYREHDIFVMPSFTESFGLVYVEALTQGLPVIYTKGQGFDGQFKDGEVGYGVAARDCFEIADKILKIYSSRIITKKIECTKFQWIHIIKLYIKIYNSINIKKETMVSWHLK